MTRGAVAMVVAGLASVLGGCAQPAAPDGPPIAAVHRVQCGRCHAAPEPGSHPRGFFADAFTRHQKRVHLTADEWAAITNYLAAPDGSTTPQRD